MKFKATAQVRLKREVLDPQGDAIRRALGTLGHAEIQRVRVGKLIEIELDASDEASAKVELEAMCAKLLANPVIEDFTLEVRAI